MLEGKEYMVWDIFFSFVFGYAGTWLGLQDDTSLTYILVLYTYLVSQ